MKHLFKIAVIFGFSSLSCLDVQAYFCFDTFPEIRTINCVNGQYPSSYTFDYYHALMSCATAICPRCGGDSNSNAIYLCGASDCGGSGYEITARCSSLSKVKGQNAKAPSKNVPKKSTIKH